MLRPVLFTLMIVMLAIALFVGYTSSAEAQTNVVVELVQAVELPGSFVVVDAEPLGEAIIAVLAGPEGFEIARFSEGVAEWSRQLEPPDGIRGFEPIALEVVGESILVYGRGKAGLEEAIVKYRVGLGGEGPTLEAVYGLGEAVNVYGAVLGEGGLLAFGSSFSSLESGWDPTIFVLDPAAGIVKLQAVFEMPGENRASSAVVVDEYSCMVVETGSKDVEPAVTVDCFNINTGAAVAEVVMPTGGPSGILVVDECLVWWSGGKAMHSPLPPDTGLAERLEGLDRYYAATKLVVGDTTLLAVGGIDGGLPAFNLMEGCPPAVRAEVSIGVQGAVVGLWGGEGEILAYIASPGSTALALYKIIINEDEPSKTVTAIDDNATEARSPEPVEDAEPPPLTTLGLAAALAALLAVAAYLRLRSRKP